MIGPRLTLDDLSPQQRLASELGGEILGPSTIKVGNRLVVASVTGVIRVDGQAIGVWRDETDLLAARFRALS